MEKRDSNRTNMIETTIEYCEKHLAVTSGIGAFAGVFAQAKARKSEINVLNGIGQSSTMGVTEDTDLLRNKLCDVALKCSNATLAFAHSINNNTQAGLPEPEAGNCE